MNKKDQKISKLWAEKKEMSKKKLLFLKKHSKKNKLRKQVLVKEAWIFEFSELHDNLERFQAQMVKKKSKSDQKRKSEIDR